MLHQSRPKIRCREIGDADLAGIADLLAKSFTNRENQELRLRRLAERDSPDGLPRFGYLIEQDRRLVGAILTIFSKLAIAGTSVTRCNLSSWHVEPEYKAYGTLLISQALKHKDAVYLNVTARPSVRPIVEAQGFSRYSEGLFVAVPLLAPSFAATTTIVGAGEVSNDSPTLRGLAPSEQTLLSDHSHYGCLSLACETGEGIQPFVFARRDLKGLIPCMQLVYCRGIDEFVRFAGVIGRVLARRGIFLITVDATEPIRGLAGKYYPGKMPKFIKGGSVRLGDLAYTNVALFADL
jgi:hypothetical protein